MVSCRENKELSLSKKDYTENKKEVTPRNCANGEVVWKDKIYESLKRALLEMVRTKKARWRMLYHSASSTSFVHICVTFMEFKEYKYLFQNIRKRKDQ